MRDGLPTPGSLDALLAPRAVAVIGASDDPDRIGGRPLRYLIDGGYAGAVHPVNPRRAIVQGLDAYPDIGAVPGPVDLAVIAVPAPATIPALEACAAHGVGAAVVFASGFAELGGDGAAGQAAIAALARDSGMRVLGPNCLGFCNAHLGVYGTFSTSIEIEKPLPGPVAVVSQSGAYGAHVAFLARRRGIPTGYWITTGNECDVELAECIEWLAGRPDVRVIAAAAEGARDGPRLRRALEAARAASTPVVFLKMGRTAIGAAAARTHTDALAGSDAVYDAVLARHGAWRAGDTDELLDVAYAASFGQLPASDRLGLLSISGGVGIQMADAAAAHGFELPPMPAPAQARMKARLPFCSPVNPVDITAQVFNQPELLAGNIEAMLDEGGYAAVVAFFTYVAGVEFMVEPIAAVAGAARSAHPDRPLVLSIIGPREIVARYEALGCPVFEDPVRAVRALAALRHFARAFARAADPAPVAAAAPDIPRRALDEREAMRIVAAAGIATVEARLARSAAEAARAACAIGFPVVMKIASPDVAHKTEVGGVLLGVASAAAARRGYAALVARLREARPGARLTGVLVSRQIEGGVEAILGVSRDPVFGPVIAVGLGGILVEVLGDRSLGLPPIGPAAARRMVERLRGFPLLAGARGRARCDVDALVDAVVRIAAFASANADAVEGIDVNPLLVLPEGQGAVALDALVIARDPNPRPGPAAGSRSPAGANAGQCASREREGLSMEPDAHITAHYASGALLERLRAALADDGVDPERPTLAALAPYNQFHGRGLEATEELANGIDVSATDHLLDVGSGIGGPARYLADRFGCRVTGIDLTAEFVEAARRLTRALGLDDRVAFEPGNALAMPFDAGTFDGAYSMNVSMNIADKGALYREIRRVLRPGAWLVLSEIAQGPAGPPDYPTPWARTAGSSFLATPGDTRAGLESCGFTVERFRETTAKALAFGARSRAMVERGEKPPHRAVQLIHGEIAADAMKHTAEALRDGRLVPIEIVCRR